jgi:hypothetical protein
MGPNAFDWVHSHGQNINTLSRPPNTGHRTLAQGSTGGHTPRHTPRHTAGTGQHTRRTGPLTKEEVFRVEIRLTFGL